MNDAQTISSKPGVLIVDDEPCILSSLSDLLEAEFDVITTTDPDLGLEYLSTREIAVLLSDQRMPRMQGDELLSRAKQVSTAMRILITAFTDISALARAINDGGIHAYITKPWDPVGLRSTIRHAARQYELAKMLRHERDLLRTVIDNVPDCVYVQDPEGHYKLVNPAFVRLLSLPDERAAIGRRDVEILPGQVASEAKSDRQRIVETGQPIVDKWDQLVSRDGHARWFSTTRVPVRDASGAVQALVGISRDMTERKELELLLKRAKDAAEATLQGKRDFLARTSHEIRTPLNVILGTSELLFQRTLSEEDRKLSQLFHDNCESLLVMLNDLVDLSRMEMEELRLEAAVFRVDQAVESVVESYRSKAAQKGVELVCDISSNAPKAAVGDVGRLKQILRNLIDNAVKFTMSGQIRVAVECLSRQTDTAELQFTVSDTGIGVQPEKCNAIFEPFTQAGPFITRDYGGSGLGLAICRHLVSHMGGEITLKSSPGVGSTFQFNAFFSLPADGVTVRQKKTSSVQKGADAPERCQACDLAAQACVLQHRLEPLKVLLAEDNPSNVALMQVYLARCPVRLTVAEDGARAVEAFLKDRFDLVFMDLQMPVMDGLSATRKIRKCEAESQRPSTPVVALTAHAVDSGEADSREAGCSGHLTKPVFKRDIVAAISEHALKTSPSTPPTRVYSQV